MYRRDSLAVIKNSRTFRVNSVRCVKSNRFLAFYLFSFLFSLFFLTAKYSTNKMQHFDMLYISQNCASNCDARRLRGVVWKVLEFFLLLRDSPLKVASSLRPNYTSPIIPIIQSIPYFKPSRKRLFPFFSRSTLSAFVIFSLTITHLPSSFNCSILQLIRLHSSPLIYDSSALFCLSLAKESM